MVAAAIACKLQQSGQRVVLAELGDQSSYQYIFDVEPEQKPIETRLGFDLCRWSGESCLKEYVRYLLPSERLVKLFFDNSVMKALIQAAPALEELAIMGKITSGLRKVGPALDYDSVVVDCYSTGHFKALVEAPAGMAQAISIGPMGEQSRSIDEVFKNSDKTKVFIVCLPEELPTQETIELLGHLDQHHQVKAQVLVNKIWPVELSKTQLSDLNNEATTDEERAFLSYLSHELEATEQSLRSLRGLDPLRLPMIFKGSSIELIESLSRRIEMKWLIS